MTLVSEFRLMSHSVLYDLMYPVSVLTNVLSILDTSNTGVTMNVVLFLLNKNNVESIYNIPYLVNIICVDHHSYKSYYHHK